MIDVYNMLIDHVLCLDCVLRWIALLNTRISVRTSWLKFFFCKMVQNRSGQQLQFWTRSVWVLWKARKLFQFLHKINN